MSRLLIVDATDKGAMGKAWAAGAILTRWRFQHVIHAHSSWDDVCWKLKRINDGELVEVVFWGHSSPGFVGLGSKDKRDNLQPEHMSVIGSKVAEGGLVWFRSCGLFARLEDRPDLDGRKFAELLANTMKCRVAAHTRNIGFPWHSGTYSLVPGQKPYWPETEVYDKKTGTYSSGPGVPRTMLFSQMHLPEGW